LLPAPTSSILIATLSPGASRPGAARAGHRLAFWVGAASAGGRM